jgi:hypothetical protein
MRSCLRTVFPLLAFSVLIATVNAFGHAGSFERMFLYYAVRLDRQLHNGLPGKLLPDCPGDCTFNDFINRVEGRTGLDITSDPNPSVAETAAKLTDQELNNRIKPAKMYPNGRLFDNESKYKYHEMIGDIADYLALNEETINQNKDMKKSRKMATKAIKLSKEARQIRWHEKLQQKLREKGWTAVTKDLKLKGYHPKDPPQIVKLKDTINAYPESRKKIENIYAETEGKPLDNSHDNMVTTIDDVLTKICKI